MECSVKLALIGAVAVGKTSIINRYVKKDFNIQEKSTLGQSVFYTQEQIMIDGHPVVARITLVDTAGMEKYRSMTASFLRGVDGVLIVFDITHRDTFDEIGFWNNLVMQ